MLIGEDGLNKLKKAHVAVVGVGGVGSFIAESLVRAGLGHITIIDMDSISPSNVNRQIHAMQSTIGMSKVEVMAARLKDINPNLCVTPVHMCIGQDNIANIITEDFDYVADAIDMVTAKIALIAHCKQHHIRIISSMGTGNKLNPASLTYTDVFKTHTDPLARVMRRELKARGISSLDVVYSPEMPTKPIGKDGKPLRTPASMPFVPASAGLLIGATIASALIG